ncbi:MAG: vWA domain-containing protein [Polyangiaceae bacterium]
MSEPRMRRRPLAPLFALLLGLAPSVAAADVVEQPRAIDVVLHPTYADVSVMVSIANDEPAQMLDVYTPLGGGFATDLSVMIAGQWRRARFVETAQATGLFQAAFDGSGEGNPAGAIWAWESPYSSQISVALPAKAPTSLVYAVIVPIDERSSGRCAVSLDGFATSPGGMTHIRLAEGLSSLVVDGVRSVDGTAAVDAAAGSAVSFEAPTTETISGDIAVLRATDPGSAKSATDKGDRAVIDAYFDTATRLGEVPRDAHVVVVVDGSKSLDAPDRDAMLSAARGYVSHFEGRGGKVAIVTFDRRVTSSAFLEPSEATEALAALVTRAPRNGSNMDEALVEAGRLLAPHPGARRIVVLGDLEAPKRIHPDDLAGVLPANTLLHVVRIDGASTASLSRDDGTLWSPLARSTGGLAWGAFADSDLEASHAVFEELARPMRLDGVRVSPALAEGDPRTAGDLGSIPEGQRYAGTVIAPITATSLTVEGELWATPVTRTIAGSSGYRKLAAGRVFSSRGRVDEVEPGRRKELALLAHALSPDTSFVFVEGTGGALEYSSSGEPGRLGGSHRTKPPRVRMGSSSLDEFDADGWLARALHPLAAACGVTEFGELRVRIESTEDEIADVGVTGAPSPAIESCVVEAAWELDLDPTFGRYGHREWQVVP